MNVAVWLRGLALDRFLVKHCGHEFLGNVALDQPLAVFGEHRLVPDLVIQRQPDKPAEQQEAKLWELRAAVSFARLRRDQGRRAEARNLLASVYGWFTEGFATPDLKDAKALLDELA